MWQGKKKPDFTYVLFTHQMNPAKIVLQRIIQLKLNLVKTAKFGNKTYCEREVMLSKTLTNGLVFVKHLTNENFR